jgi:hypothetical protein
MAIVMDAKNERAANSNAIFRGALRSDFHPYDPHYWMRWELKSSALMIDGLILDTFKIREDRAEKDERLDQPIYVTRNPRVEV